VSENHTRGDPYGDDKNSDYHELTQFFRSGKWHSTLVAGSLLIKMYFREHGVPHFHALYGEFNGVFDIDKLEMIEGDMPKRAQKLIIEWAENYKGDLLEMWKTQSYKNLPGLE
jgi:hypothetical protein